MALIKAQAPTFKRQTKCTFHPVQVVLCAAAEADTVRGVKRSVSFNEIVSLEAGHPLKSVNILNGHTRLNVSTTLERVDVQHVKWRLFVLLPESSNVSGAPCPSAA